MQKHNLTLRGETWGVFYHFQLLRLKKKSPQLVGKLYIFSCGYVLHGTQRLEARQAEKQQEAGPKWEVGWRAE